MRSRGAVAVLPMMPATAPLTSRCVGLHTIGMVPVAGRHPYRHVASRNGNEPRSRLVHLLGNARAHMRVRRAVSHRSCVSSMLRLLIQAPRVIAVGFDPLPKVKKKSAIVPVEPAGGPPPRRRGHSRRRR
jgi:hypothetical protein